MDKKNVTPAEKTDPVIANDIASDKRAQEGEVK